MEPPSRYRSGLAGTEPLPNLPESFPNFTKKYFDKYYYVPPVGADTLKILNRPVTSHLSDLPLPKNQDLYQPSPEQQVYDPYKYQGGFQPMYPYPISTSLNQYYPLTPQHYYPHDTRYDYFDPSIKAGLDFSEKRAEAIYQTAAKESTKFQSSRSGLLSPRNYEATPLQKVQPSNQVRYSDYLNKYIRSVESNRDLGSTTATIPHEMLRNRSPGSEIKAFEPVKGVESSSKKDLSSNRLYDVEDIKKKYERLSVS